MVASYPETMRGKYTYLLKWLGKQLDTGDALYEEDSLGYGVYKYFTKASLNKFKGMEFFMERHRMMVKSSAAPRNVPQE